MRILLSLGWLLGVSGVLCAKTVAIWPIDWDYDNQAYDLRCATDSAYDLEAMKELSPGVVEQNTPDDSLPWNLPPNLQWNAA